MWYNNINICHANLYNESYGRMEYANDHIFNWIGGGGVFVRCKFNTLPNVFVSFDKYTKEI